MPSRTECQIAADALHQTFLVNLIVEAEAELYDVGSDLEYSSSSQSSAGSTDSSSLLSSSDDEDVLPESQVYLDALGELYSQRYLNSQEKSLKMVHIFGCCLWSGKSITQKYFIPISTLTLPALTESRRPCPVSEILAQCST